MTYRPEGWEERYKKENLHNYRLEQECIKETFESGVDAILGELKKQPTSNRGYCHQGKYDNSLELAFGTWVFIPDDDINSGYTLNCQKCGCPYFSTEAFPGIQICPKCCNPETHFS